MKFIFKSKAKSLVFLKKKIKNAKVPESYYFTVGNWKRNKKNILNNINKIFKYENLIVRSSAIDEDNLKASNAGKYLSLLNIRFIDLEKSINKVISSYHKKSDKNEVLIQSMIKNVVMSGVVFSHDPNTCSPYVTINWSEGSDTTSVTSGKKSYIWQHCNHQKEHIPKKFKSILKMLNELFLIYKNIPIDCEFAVSKNKNKVNLWLLQARPLILQSKSISKNDLSFYLKNIENKISLNMRRHPFLLGKKTVFGVMPDWNPAEIIGIRPKPLALSLYRELITDSIWAYQRHNYGYRNLRSFPLMQSFYGLPYIDLRLSFNSFVPADLDSKLGEKLVNYYLKTIIKKPKLNDKIEFDIVFSCFTFDLKKRLKVLLKDKFTNKDINSIFKNLLKLTNKIIDPKKGLWILDSSKIKLLNLRREKILKSNMDDLGKIFWLIEDTKRYGTLPFAGLARAGFIAVQILQSLVSTGIFSEKEHDLFINSISTVSTELSNDKLLMSKKKFLQKYGHLRPGTYDIESFRYDENPNLYFNWSTKDIKKRKHKTFSPSKSQLRKIDNLIKISGLKLSSKDLLSFIKSGIILREYSKFCFSKNLSDILSLIIKYGKKYNFSRSDLSYSNISTFLNLNIDSIHPEKIINESLRIGKKSHEKCSYLSMPPLIINKKDIWSFKWSEAIPNFITHKKITATVVGYKNKNKLKGAIVCIPYADPGFDWIFSHKIKGLITAWGGSNSHMAIRAAEQGIPSVIGAGEILYKKYSSSKKISIDCLNKKVELIY